MRFGFDDGDDDFDTSPKKFANYSMTSLCCQNDVCSTTKEEGQDNSFRRSSHGTCNSGTCSVGCDELSVDDSDEQEGKYYYGVFALNQMMERHIKPTVTALLRLKTLAKTNSDGDIAAFFEATADDILERIEQMSSFGITGCSMLRYQYSHLGSEVLAALEDRQRRKPKSITYHGQVAGNVMSCWPIIPYQKLKRLQTSKMLVRLSIAHQAYPRIHMTRMCLHFQP